MSDDKGKAHQDTVVKLHPLRFEEAIKALADSPPQKKKRTKKASGRGRAPSRKRNAPRR